MVPQTESNPERVLGSFASLLSSALTIDPDVSAAKPLGDSGETLQCFISPSVPDDEICCILPSLMLKHSSSSTGTSPSSLEQSVSSKLASPLRLCRNELRAVPMLLLGNVSNSFMTLVDSRLRSSFAALVRQSRTQRNEALSKVLIGLLASVESPISSTALVASFRVLPVLDRTPSGDALLPLVMEAVVDLSVLGELVSVKIVAPGTIQGTFGATPEEDIMSKVEIIFDTMALLHSMMKQARFAVRKALAVFSNIASTLLTAIDSNTTLSPGPSVDSLLSLKGNQDKDSLSTEKDYSSSGTSLTANKGCSLMPPPPRRPSRRSLGSLGELRRQAGAKSASTSSTMSMQNASWGDVRRGMPSGDGLMLLTTAAGLKRNRGPNEVLLHDNAKRLRAESSDGNVSIHRKVTSCPSLPTNNVVSARAQQQGLNLFV